jgi:type II secretory pathway pseudopilin PulG
MRRIDMELEQGCARRRAGLSLAEGIVVILVVLVLGSLILPLFAHPRGHSRTSTCISQTRQLATAIQMYVQDNKSRYPNSTWLKDIDNYVGSEKIYYCPSDAADDMKSPVSYGYSGLLVRADGTGINEAQVKAPTEVGAIADATPARAWADGGGLIGGGALGTAPTVQIDPTRHVGAIVGFCDGHAKYFPGKILNLRDIASPLSRAFYQAPALGLTQNYSGGVNAVAVTPTKRTVTVGGDCAGLPMVIAAVEIWKARGGTWFTKGFYGCGYNYADAKKRKDYLWTSAAPEAKGTTIARDALVVIVSQNCMIDGLSGVPGEAWGAPAGSATTAEIATLFTTGQSCVKTANNRLIATPGYEMETGRHWQAYTYLGAGGRDYNGNTLAFRQWLLNGGRIGTYAVRCHDDYEMVDKVAADPYGIGFCSSAMADTSKVRILDLTVDGNVFNFPQRNTKMRWVVPETPAASGYPYIRSIRAEVGGDGKKLLPIFAAKNFLAGPLFQASYWRP